MASRGRYQSRVLESYAEEEEDALIEPTLERVTIPDDKIAEAIHNLLTRYELPDGTEVVSDLRVFHKQLSAGYYYQLVWPRHTTREDLYAWYDMTKRVLAWHKLGVV